MFLVTIMERLNKSLFFKLFMLIFCLFSITHVSALNIPELTQVIINFNDWKKVGCSEPQPFDQRQIEMEKYTQEIDLPDYCSEFYSLDSNSDIFYYCSKKGEMPFFPEETYCESDLCEYITTELKLDKVNKKIYFGGYGSYTNSSNHYSNDFWISFRDGSNTHISGPGINLCDEPSNDVNDSNGIIERDVNNNSLKLKVAIDSCAYSSGRIGTADFIFIFNNSIDMNKNNKPDFCESEGAELFISPDYPSLEKEDLSYEEIFPLAPVANLTINDKSNRTSFIVYYKLSITYPNSTTEILEQGERICGKKCSFQFPKNKIEQNSLLTAEVRVSDMLNNSIPNGTAIAHLYTPYFNLYPLYIKAMNVIKDVDLVSNKPIAVREWVQLESYVKKYIKDKPPQIIDNYIDSVKNVKFDLYMDGKKERTITKKEVKRYIDPEILKRKVEYERDSKSMKILREYKVANETANFVGIFPPKDKVGNLNFKIIINPDRDIEEADYEDNSKSANYNLRAQKDSDFEIAVVMVDFFDNDEVLFGKNFEIVKNRIDKSMQYLLSAFPLDPTKTHITTRKIAIKISDSEMEKIKNWNKSSSVYKKTFQILQKIADKESHSSQFPNKRYDLIYGFLDSRVINYKDRKGIEGLTKPNNYDKVALIAINSATTPMRMAMSVTHEAGHLFTKSYHDKEQKVCDIPSEDIGLLSYEGWCMDQRTGKDCDFEIKPPLVAGQNNSANINIWYDKDKNGCYNIIDGPKGDVVIGMSPSAAGKRAPDIMTLNGNDGIGVWPTKNPTYIELMDHFLN